MLVKRKRTVTVAKCIPLGKPKEAVELIFGYGVQPGVVMGLMEEKYTVSLSMEEREVMVEEEDLPKTAVAPTPPVRKPATKRNSKPQAKVVAKAEDEDLVETGTDVVDLTDSDSLEID